MQNFTFNIRNIFRKLSFSEEHRPYSTYSPETANSLENFVKACTPHATDPNQPFIQVLKQEQSDLSHYKQLTTALRKKSPNTAELKIISNGYNTITTKTSPSHNIALFMDGIIPENEADRIPLEEGKVEIYPIMKALSLSADAVLKTLDNQPRSETLSL